MKLSSDQQASILVLIGALLAFSLVFVVNYQAEQKAKRQENSGYSIFDDSEKLELSQPLIWRK